MLSSAFPLCSILLTISAVIIVQKSNVAFNKRFIVLSFGGKIFCLVSFLKCRFLSSWAVSDTAWETNCLPSCSSTVLLPCIWFGLPRVSLASLQELQ